MYQRLWYLHNVRKRCEGLEMFRVFALRYSDSLLMAFANGRGFLCNKECGVWMLFGKVTKDERCLGFLHYNVQILDSCL